MVTRWLTPDSSEKGMLANILMSHDPRANTDDPLVKVQVHVIRNMRFCPRATALWHGGDVMTATDIAENAEHLRNISSVGFSRAGITRETAEGVVEELSKLNNVKALNMRGNQVGSASSALGGLSSISSLQFLSLSGCGLSSDDVLAVTSSCRRLLHLDIGCNHGIWGDDVRSRKLTGLCVRMCGMKGDELIEMAARNRETLTYLNATGNPVLTSSHINALLTHCPRLLELYTDEGGELVRALSERRTGCRLNHLWLCDCVLSSSSSSGRQVNSSELGDVIMRHSSISSLTLHRCHFYPDVMSHFSSSMAFITSLYISPDHPPPRPSYVASLVRASRGLTRLWLDGVHDVWGVSDYVQVIDAVNASPALRVVGLDVERLTVDEVHVVVKALTCPLARLWLAVNYYRETRVYAEVKMERELGVVNLVPAFSDLYGSYVHESGSFYQHLLPSLPDDYRPPI